VQVLDVDTKTTRRHSHFVHFEKLFYPLRYGRTRKQNRSAILKDVLRFQDTEDVVTSALIHFVNNKKFLATFRQTFELQLLQ